jgi:CYTH domain-containing protein
MSLEIERKYLVAHDGWKRAVVRTAHIRDGLVAVMNGRKARVRIMDVQATIALKGTHEGKEIGRAEYEYAIPLADAEEILRTMCDDRVLEKTRHYVPHAGLTLEVDIYTGLLHGIVIAEVELDRADRAVTLPDWVGAEVTGDIAFTKHHMFEARTLEAKAAARR